MKLRYIAFTAAAASIAAGGAQAQNMSAEELRSALQQAQAAAAQAQAAADKAIAALKQVQEAASRAEAASQAQMAGSADSKGAQMGTVTSPTKGGSGLTLTSGPNSVTLYGLIDGTVSRRTNADAKGNSVSGFQDAWFSGNRWGLTGKREVGDGLKAIFRLESELNYRDGVGPDVPSLFNRDAWLGLESDGLGKLTFGRQNTLARDFSQNYGDPYGTAATTLEEGGWTNNNNFKQMIFYAGSATGTRYNDGVVWKKRYGEWVTGVGYQFGGIPGDFEKGSTKTLALGYNGGVFNVSGFINSANVASFTHTSYSLGGNYQIGMARLNAGYFHYTAEQPGALGKRTDNAYTLSAKFVPGGRFDYEVGYQNMKASNAAVNGSGYVLNAFANTSSATATATGNRKTLYGSVFYHLDQTTELYFALDRMSTDGTYKAAQANGFMSQTEIGMGLRIRF